jgi:hypothetical protein
MGHSWRELHPDEADAYDRHMERWERFKQIRDPLRRERSSWFTVEELELLFIGYGQFNPANTDKLVAKIEELYQKSYGRPAP